MVEERLSRLREYVEKSRALVFFGGAGVSTESGIPDFRSTDGLYHQEWKYPPDFEPQLFRAAYGRVLPFL